MNLSVSAKENINVSINRDKINSLCVALFLSARLIVQSLPAKLQFDNILILLLSLVFFIAILNNRFRFNLKTVFVFGIVVLIPFSLTFIVNGPDSNNLLYLLYFFAYGGIGLYLSDKNFLSEKVYKYIINISIILLPFVINKNFHTNEDTWMGLSYSLLPLLFAGIIYMTTVVDKQYFKYITFITLIIYIFEIISFFTRGAVVATIIFIIIFTIIRFFKNSFRRNLLLILMVISIWFTYVNLQNILLFVNNFALQNGLHIRFIEKSLHLMSYGNLWNGRNDYYEHALIGILKSPIFGNGIGSFETDTGLIYTHNLFLQLAYEGGVFFVLPCIIILVYGGVIIVFRENIDINIRIFLLFVFSIGLFRLLVSSVYWGEQSFWFLVGYIMLNKNCRKSLN